jgi:penicillin-binding protein 2
MNVKLDKNGRSEDTKIFTYINVAVVIAFALIFSRLLYLQIIKGDDFRNLSENNRIRIQEVPAPRGILYDREGIPLVDSFPAFDVSVFRQDIRKPEALIKPLSRALLLEPQKLEARLVAARELPPSQPIKLKTNIGREELAMVETHRLDLPGVMVDVVIRRNYPYGPMASHLIGYLGEVNQDELEREEYSGHKVGYMVGKYGVEQRFELDLMGESGGRQIEVNALGRKMRVLGSVEPNPGNNLYLTLDLELQKAAEEAMAGKNGAVVAMDPQSGDIFALVSKPDFDPNLFSRGISSENWKSIINNPARPLQNRATQGQYPPGSVFKIIMALAALEEKVITPDTAFHCSGALNFGNRDYHCWKKEGHGRVDLRRALVESCDVYFYQVGLRLGVDRIAKYANAVGLGKLTGYPLGQEKAGLIPTSSWKMKRFRVPWQAGETLSTAIGQGFNLTTPFQMACSLSALFNGGRYFQPRIVQSVRAPHGEVIQEFSPSILKNIHMTPEHVEFIREALWGVVNAPGGTGSRARVQGFDVAGKTGTSQVIGKREGRSDASSPEFQDHAWFACFAPAQNPEITVVAFVEHGGGGGAVAAPVAKKVIENYYTRKKLRAPSPLQVALQNPTLPSSH